MDSRVDRVCATRHCRASSVWIFLAFFSGVVVILAAGPVAEGLEVPFRGVEPAKAGLYKTAIETGVFKCIKSKGSVPVSQLNDDYCDCLDGSDEPGTSACSRGSFYCVNEGHTGRAISSSRVDDGVCDCCDGSDEAIGKCEPTCEDRQIEQDKDEAVAIETLEAALKKKDSMLKPGGGNKPTMGRESKQIVKTQERLEKLYDTILKAQQGSVSEAEGQKALKKFYKAQDSVASLQRVIKADVGQKGEFYPMAGKCSKAVRNELQYRGGTSADGGIPEVYTFELCPFDRVTQTKFLPKKEKGEVVEDVKPTVLGYFAGWEGRDYSKMLFANGDPCWGGPDREVVVTLQCGVTPAITRINEDGKCLYEMTYETPLACSHNHLVALKLSSAKL